MDDEEKLGNNNYETVVTKDKLNEAEMFILATSNPLMQERNKKHQVSGELNPLKYENLTFVGIRHASGLNNPDIQACLSELRNYVAKPLLPGQKRIVIVEGYQDGNVPRYKSLSDAANHGEMAAVAQMAYEANIPVKSLEIPLSEATKELEKQDPNITAREFTLYQVLLNLGKNVSAEGNFNEAFLGGLLYYLDKTIGNNFINTLSEEQLAHFNKTRQLPEETQKEVLNKYKPELNQLMQAITRRDLFLPNGRVNTQNLGTMPWNSFINGLVIPGAKGPETLLKKIGNEFNNARNRYILKETANLTKQGYHPIEFYGSAHADALEDAFNHLYGSKDLSKSDSQEILRL